MAFPVKAGVSNTLNIALLSAVIRLSCFLFLFCCSAMSDSQATGDAFKNALFRDCNEAMRVFQEIDPDEEVETYTYLVRVLMLSTEAPDVAEAFLPAPGGGRNSVPSWQSVDARRELVAKRCALELLESAGSRAMPALPGLASVYSQQELSDELAVRIEEVAADIAARSHMSGIVLSAQDTDAVINNLVAPHPLVAKNLLTEFIDSSLPRMIVAVAGTNERLRAGVIQLLKEIDPDRTKTFSALLKLAPGLDAQGINRILAAFPLPPRLSLTKLLPEVNFGPSECPPRNSHTEALTVAPVSTKLQGDNVEKHTFSIVDGLAELAAAPSPELSVQFGKMLGKACVSLGSLSLSPVESASLVAKPYLGLIGPDSFPLEMQKCFVRSIPEFKDSVRKMLLEGDDSQVEFALQLLESALPNLSGRDRTLIYARLRDRASGNDSAALKALSLLSLFGERNDDTARLYFQRARYARDESELQSSLRRSILEGLGRLTFASHIDRFSAILVDWLRSGYDSDSVAEILSKRLPHFESELLTAWRNGSVVMRMRILEVFNAAVAVSTRALRFVADGYSAPDLRFDIDRLFRVQSQRVPNPISDMRRDIGGASRIDTLRRYVEYRIAGARDSAEFAGLLTKGSCAGLETYSRALYLLLENETLSAAVRSPLQGRLAVCISEVSPSLAQAWTEQVPFEEFNPSLLERTPLPVNSDYASALDTLLENAALRQDAAWFPVFSRAISEGNRQNRIVALTRLAAMSGDLPGPVSDVVRQTIRDYPDDDSVRELSLLVLARHASSEYDWGSFVRGMIDKCGNGSAPVRDLRIAKYLPSQTIINELLPALQSDETGTVLGAMRVGALLGKGGFSLVPALWELRENATPSVRYAAVLALLEINPLTPGLHEMLARLLTNRFFSQAIDRPIEWERTAAVAVLNRRGNGCLREFRLEKLARMSSSTGVLSNP